MANNRHNIHRHTANENYNLYSVIDEIEPGEIAINTTYARPYVVFRSKSNASDTDFSKLVVLEQVTVTTAATDNVRPGIFNGNISGFTAKLSDNFQPTGSLTPGMTIDSAITVLQNSISVISGGTVGDLATFNGTSVGSNTAFKTGTINGSAITTTNGTANNFSIGTINGVPLVKYGDSITNNIVVAESAHTHNPSDITGSSSGDILVCGPNGKGEWKPASAISSAITTTDEKVAYSTTTAQTYLLGATLTASTGSTANTQSGVYMYQNNLYAAGFYETSDATLKDFGKDIEIDFDKIKSIPKKYFTWKEGTDTNKHIGTSAQELQKVYPELVRKGANDKLTVDYAMLSVIALAAVDKLKEENDELKRRIEDIEEYLTRKNMK